MRRRWKPIALLSIAAALLHAAIFSGADWGWPQADAASVPPAAMQVRVVDALPLPSAGSNPEAPLSPVVPPAAHRTKRASATTHRETAVRVAPAHTAAVSATPAPEATAAPVLLAQRTPEASPPGPSAPDEESIPHYPTRLPPPMTLRYELQRGMLRGIGELSWRPQGDRYEMALEARVSGLPVLMQASQGGIGADGIAPVRYTDQRLRKSATAANFQRDAGKITFSGSAAEFPLRVGTQDRLSWMVQLAAIVSADPQRATPGAKVLMQVVGSQGDASVWAFRCVGPETLQTRAGAVEAIKFVREPREVYDTTIQVWLDIHRHALPVHATQKSGPGDEGYELHLQEMVAPS